MWRRRKSVGYEGRPRQDHRRRWSPFLGREEEIDLERSKVRVVVEMFGRRPLSSWSSIRWSGSTTKRGKDPVSPARGRNCINSVSTTFK